MPLKVAGLATVLVVFATYFAIVDRASAGADAGASARPGLAEAEITQEFLSTDAAWVQQAREPVNIELVDRRGETTEVRSTGQLDEAARAQLDLLLRSQVQTMYRDWEATCNKVGSGSNGEKTLREAIREIEQLVVVRRTEAAIDLLKSGDYLTFVAGSGEANKLRLPRGYAPVRSYNGGLVNGRIVDVVIPVPPTHGLVKPIVDELHAMRSVQRDSDMQTFNELSLPDRRAKVQAHYAAVGQIRDLARDTRVPLRDKEARLHVLFKAVLPEQWGFTSDFTAFVSER